MTKRIDVHRPGAIVPAHYSEVLHYSLVSTHHGFPVPAFGVDCSATVAVYDSAGRHTGYRNPECPDSGLCCVASASRRALAEGREIFGTAGRCGVCGACYVHGSLFRHDGGALVHMGHDCAAKYQMMFDLSAHELELGRQRRALGAAIARRVHDEERAEFLAAHPGLAEALELGDSEGTRPAQIVADVRARFVQYREISDKQIALVMRLADEIRNPRPAQPEERPAVAPTGRVDFVGEIVSTKVRDGFAGPEYKMTIKVVTEDGSVWLAHGTIPRVLADAGPIAELRGRRVSVRATLERPRPRAAEDLETDSGRERAHAQAERQNFVFMRRPTAGFADLVDHPRQRVTRRRAPRAVADAAERDTLGA